MKRTPVSTLVLALLVGVSTLATGYALAQSAVKDPLATPGIDQRQAKQQARIHQGVASGKITPAELARLQTQQHQIAANKAAAKADGVVTKHERKSLKQQQKQARRDIAHSKRKHRAG